LITLTLERLGSQLYPASSIQHPASLVPGNELRFSQPVSLEKKLR
jgi:hypothetical protein